MMENKCNKIPNNKYLDHVYCHTTENKNYIRANNNNASGNGGGTGGGNITAGQDVMALLKENKQLKAMLILHLDLIQEQSDQLMAKDKLLIGVREESEGLKSKNAQLEAQVQELQKQLQRQMKRVVAGGEVSTLPPPPLAKIQCKVEPTTAEINVQSLLRPTTEEHKSDKEELLKEQEKQSKSSKKNYKIQDTKNVGAQPAMGKGNTIIGECNGKLISKIILHRVNTAGLRSPLSTASDSASEMEMDSTRKISESVMKTATGNTTTGDELDEEDDEDEDEDDNLSIDATSTVRLKKRPVLLSLTMPRGAKPRKPLLSTTPSKTATVKVCITPPTPSRGGKQMPLMLSHAPEMHSDESASCDSIAEGELRTPSVTSPASLPMSPKDAKQHAHKLAPPPHSHRPKARRCGYISSSQKYCTREWEDEEFICSYEFTKEDVNALQADAPMLEIPKWTEHDIAVSYCIEGTEDLSDDTFLKRHAKLEVDEKRRKKWDVQQIREQRRIEKLKRRHCKEELQNAPEQQPMLSFYPQTDALQTICFMNDLPVQAFGEVIPKLSTHAHFVLPWLDCSHLAAGLASVATLSCGNVSTTSTQAQHQMLNSSFVFMKKRRRQQSSSGAPATRQRQAVAVAAVAAATVNASKIVTATTATVTALITPSLTSNVNPTEAI